MLLSVFSSATVVAADPIRLRLDWEPANFCVASIVLSAGETASVRTAKEPHSTVTFQADWSGDAKVVAVDLHLSDSSASGTSAKLTLKPGERQEVMLASIRVGISAEAYRPGKQKPNQSLEPTPHTGR